MQTLANISCSCNAANLSVVLGAPVSELLVKCRFLFASKLCAYWVCSLGEGCQSAFLTRPQVFFATERPLP